MRGGSIRALALALSAAALATLAAAARAQEPPASPPPLSSRDRGLLAAEIGDWELAQGYLRDAYEEAPDDATALDLALAFDRAGLKPALALAWYRVALAGPSSLPEGRAAAARARAVELGRVLEGTARRLLASALALALGAPGGRWTEGFRIEVFALHAEAGLRAEARPLLAVLSEDARARAEAVADGIEALRSAHAAGRVRRVELRLAEGGRVVSVDVLPGQVVRAGEVLARAVAPGDAEEVEQTFATLETALAASQAELEQREVECRRVERLRAVGAASDAEAAAAAAGRDVEAARTAQLEEALERLDGGRESFPLFMARLALARCEAEAETAARAGGGEAARAAEARLDQARRTLADCLRREERLHLRAPEAGVVGPVFLHRDADAAPGDGMPHVVLWVRDDAAAGAAPPAPARSRPWKLHARWIEADERLACPSRRLEAQLGETDRPPAQVAAEVAGDARRLLLAARLLAAGEETPAPPPAGR